MNYKDAGSWQTHLRSLSPPHQNVSEMKLASENVISFSHPQKGRSGNRGEGGDSVTSYFGAGHQEGAPDVHVSTRRTPSGSHHPRRDPLPRSRSFPLGGRECQALQMSGTGSSRPPQTGHHFPTVWQSRGSPGWPKAVHTPPSSPPRRPHPPPDSHLSHAQAPFTPTQPPQPRLLQNSYLPLLAPHFLPTLSQSQGPHYSPTSRFPPYSGHLTSGHHARPLFSFCPLTPFLHAPHSGPPPHPAPSVRPHRPYIRPPRTRAPYPGNPRHLTASLPARVPPPAAGLVRSPRAQPGPGAPHSRL